MPNVQEIAYPPELADAEAKNIDNNTSLAKMFKAVGEQEHIWGTILLFPRKDIVMNLYDASFSLFWNTLFLALVTLSLAKEPGWNDPAGLQRSHETGMDAPSP